MPARDDVCESETPKPVHARAPSPAPRGLVALLFVPAALMWTFVEAGRVAPAGLPRHVWRSTLLWTGVVTATGILFGEVGQPLLEWLPRARVAYSG